MEEASSLITCVRWIPKGKLNYTAKPEIADPEALRQIAAEVISREKALTASIMTDEAGEGAGDEADQKAHDPELQEIKEFRGSNVFSVFDNDVKQVVRDKYLRPEFLADDPELKEELAADSILPTDCPLLVSQADQLMSQSYLYIHTYETSGLYVHRALSMPAKPLCCEFLEGIFVPDAGTVLNNGYVAFGYMHVGLIEIFDLTDMDNEAPIATLGELIQSPAKLKRRKTRNKQEGHTAAVICMRKNPFNHWILATGSADFTVRIWDVSVPKTLAVLTHHTKPVQAIAWNHHDSQILASGGFDKQLVLVDCSDLSGSVRSVKTDHVIECLWWDRWSQHLLWVGDSEGYISLYDVRTFEKTSEAVPLYKVFPGDYTDIEGDMEVQRATTAIVQSCENNGLLITTLMNGMAFVWDTRGDKIKFVYREDFNKGPICTADASLDVPTLFALGASDVIVWDVGRSNVVNTAFGFPLENQIEANDAAVMSTDDESEE